MCFCKGQRVMSCAPFSFSKTDGETMSKASKKNPQHFNLRNIKPLTENQNLAFQHYDMGKNLMLHGIAGTGKTFIGMFLALEEVMKSKKYQQVIIVRSVVPSRDIGFLPGNAKEKAKVYEEPYYEICGDLYGRGDAYDVLKNKMMIQFITTSHLRGVTFRNSVVVVDEVQNMSGSECATIITRIGENCRLIFCGDFRQTDLKEKERSGFKDFMSIIKKMPSFSFIEFQIEDVVRSGLCKEFLEIQDKMGIQFT